MSGPKSRPIEERFWERIEKIEGGCWLYGGAQYGNKYGLIGVTTNPVKNITAHRFSYILHKGEIARGQVICHTCDVRNCVNPDHMYAGTHEDNTRDIVERKRNVGRVGVRVVSRVGRLSNTHGRALSKQHRLDLLKEYADGKYTQMELARRYRISQATVSATVRGAKNMGLGLHSKRRSGNFKRKLKVGSGSEILALYKAGGVTQKELAAKYGCTQSQISRIILSEEYVS